MALQDRLSRARSLKVVNTLDRGPYEIEDRREMGIHDPRLLAGMGKVCAFW